MPSQSLYLMCFLIHQTGSNQTSCVSRSCCLFDLGNGCDSDCTGYLGVLFPSGNHQVWVKLWGFVYESPTSGRITDDDASSRKSRWIWRCNSYHRSTQGKRTLERLPLPSCRWQEWFLPFAFGRWLLFAAVVAMQRGACDAGYGTRIQQCLSLNTCYLNPDVGRLV